MSWQSPHSSHSRLSRWGSSCFRGFPQGYIVGFLAFLGRRRSCDVNGPRSVSFRQFVWYRTWGCQWANRQISRCKGPSKQRGTLCAVHRVPPPWPPFSRDSCDMTPWWWSRRHRTWGGRPKRTSWASPHTHPPIRSGRRSITTQMRRSAPRWGRACAVCSTRRTIGSATWRTASGTPSLLGLSGAGSPELLAFGTSLVINLLNFAYALWLWVLYYLNTWINWLTSPGRWRKRKPRPTKSPRP